MWINLFEEVHGCGNFASSEVTRLEIESGYTEFNTQLTHPSTWVGARVSNADAFYYHEDMVKFRGATASRESVSNRELLKTWNKYFRGRLPLEAVLDRIVTSRVVSHEERLSNPPLALDIQIPEQRHLKNGPGDQAQFAQPYGVAVAPDGTVFVADQLNHAIRRIGRDGTVSTLAGGTLGDTDAVGEAACFAFPSALALSPDGWLYVADTFNHRIRRLRPDEPDRPVETVAGWHPGMNRVLHFPQGIAVGPDNTVYVADSWNHRICRIVPGGQLEPFVGEWGRKTGQFWRPYGLATDANGNLFVADSWNHRICQVKPDGRVKTLAGKEEGFRDAKGAKAAFERPYGIAVDRQGRILVADTWNHRVRRISAKGEVETLAGGKVEYHEGWPLSGELLYPHGLAVMQDDSILVTNPIDHVLSRISSEGNVTVFAGAAQTADTQGDRQDGFYDGSLVAASLSIDR